MKKISAYLHKPDVQGVLLITCIVVAIVLATVLTWGK
jgi:hypothetical protein